VTRHEYLLKGRHVEHARRFAQPRRVHRAGRRNSSTRCSYRPALVIVFLLLTVAARFRNKAIAG
jgi:hypothetical protein